MKWYKKSEITFSILFLGIFLISFLILYFLGLIPRELVVDTSRPSTLDQIQQNSLEGIAGDNQTIQTPANLEEPLRIVSAEINLDFQVVNPKSQSNVTLDSALSEGAVHYPGSGFPGYGNMFIFGHSTGYKVVNNKAYQVFNNIHNLKEGSEIKIVTKDGVYHYNVTSVKLEKDSDAYVNFSTKENILTLSTCNSFGQKEDRYVVVARFVGKST